MLISISNNFQLRIRISKTDLKARKSRNITCWWDPPDSSGWAIFLDISGSLWINRV